MLGDPKQSPGGVADDQRAHRTLLLKAPTGLRAPHQQAADAASQKPLGSCWFRPEGVVAKSSFASTLQATYSDLSKVDLELPEGLLIGLGYAATNPDSPLDFHIAQSAAERSGVAGQHRWSLMLPTVRGLPRKFTNHSLGYSTPCFAAGWETHGK